MPLGSTGVNVSRICLGTATFGVAPNERDAERVVHAALDLGINFFDTADVYGHMPTFDRPGAPPASERQPAELILGRALAGRRDEVVVATKSREVVGPGVNDRGLSRRHIIQQVENSLARLGTDYIDLYYAHAPDADTALEQSLSTYDDLVRQGKLRYVVLSNYPAWQVTEALWIADDRRLNAPVCVQVKYNSSTALPSASWLPHASSSAFPSSRTLPSTAACSQGWASWSARSRETCGSQVLGSAKQSCVSDGPSRCAARSGACDPTRFRSRGFCPARRSPPPSWAPRLLTSCMPTPQQPTSPSNQHSWRP